MIQHTEVFMEVPRTTWQVYSLRCASRFLVDTPKCASCACGAPQSQDPQHLQQFLGPGALLCRRYVYRVHQELGGMQLKSRAMAEEWLSKHFLGGGPSKRTESSQVLLLTSLQHMSPLWGRTVSGLRLEIQVPEQDQGAVVGCAYVGEERVGQRVWPDRCAD
jgi:hypothetical protein